MKKNVTIRKYIQETSHTLFSFFSKFLDNKMIEIINPIAPPIMR